MSTAEKPNTIQSLSHVVLAGAALVALFRDDKRLALALAIVVMIVILPAYYQPTRTKSICGGSGDVEMHSPVRHGRNFFYDRFFEFLFENNGSLPQVARDITQSRFPDK